MTVEPVVLISALEHYAYCPRQCALIHVDGVWVDNENTVRGTLGHRRVDSGHHRAERGRRVLRAIPLWSEVHGLAGRADAVEVDVDGGVAPVEYKMGTQHGLAAHLQLCAQAFCLEEMTGSEVPVGFLWFSGPRRRDRVPMDADLRERMLEALAAIRHDLDARALPPAVNDERCSSCQLLGHCLPDVTARPERVERYLTSEVFGCGS